MPFSFICCMTSGDDKIKSFNYGYDHKKNLEHKEKDLSQ